MVEELRVKSECKKVATIDITRLSLKYCVSEAVSTQSNTQVFRFHIKTNKVTYKKENQL